VRAKEDILAEVREALSAGVLTEMDLKPLVADLPDEPAVRPAEATPKHDKLSAVDIMFFIAGIVLFAAIMSFIIQSWEDGNPLVRIVLSAGVGAGMWSLAYYLVKNPVQSDIRKGLVNALLVTGALCVVIGGFIITNDLIGGYDSIDFIPAALTLVVLSALHVGFDRLVKRELILLLGIILGVATFPTLIFGFLQDSGMTIDVWALVLAASAGLLAVATRVVARAMPGREISSSFDGFAAFIAMGSMYVASFGEFGAFWLLFLIAAVLGLFYLSIIAQNKHLLGIGSFFMILTVVTISFKYFSGFGITTSLVVATMGLLGSAAVASSINKKYFKPKLPSA
jgi:hypothetical protein